MYGGIMRRKLLIGAITLGVVEAAVVARRRGSLFAADTIVRCGHGHLFTTLWIPGASLKSIRLGLWRIQRCPVGPHWSLVTPVQVSDLTPDERSLAMSRRDIRIP